MNFGSGVLTAKYSAFIYEYY